ncbi:MAG: UDP-N-acetylmuramate--L-alanine ligase [Spirochaetaceae bacterium]|jgi:UDP-N-acetylmuramate--alanine ligase|nr:UDP-N-acetylmuramate--L-alanine ligase [Spirochaetaceae bacterium]
MFEKGSKVYCVGIKGTGLSALAELLHGSGVLVSGSDTADVFYTDGILKSLAIPYFESFAPEHVPGDADLVIHSAAYSAESIGEGQIESNCELAEALRRGIPVMKYTDALGAWSTRFESAGISGVHGKTTTTALAGVLVRAAGLPAQVLAGSAVSSFGERSTLNNGGAFFIAETCEYRKHFLSFHPKHIVLTAVESDHQDFFPTYESIRDAFVEYALLLPEGGSLIYCADDKGACEVAELVRKSKRGIRFVPYGFTAAGDYRLSGYHAEHEKAHFDLALDEKRGGGAFTLSVPGKHNALNAAAALALIYTLSPGVVDGPDTVRRMKTGLDEFHGSKRRFEIIGERDGILFMDDYAHHPTAISATIDGLREFFPTRRIVVSFMSHTYTRTAALLDEFAASLAKADVVVLHKIYASARENCEKYEDVPAGESLYETLFKKVTALSLDKVDVDALCKNFALARENYEKYENVPVGKSLGEKLFEQVKALKKHHVFYAHEHQSEAAALLLRSVLKPGDLFITMGAGDNWKLGISVLCQERFD